MIPFVSRFTRTGEPMTEQSSTNLPGPTIGGEDAALRVLGLRPDARWSDIAEAHARLVADLTPGPGATHRNVALAEALLREVNQAFDALRVRAVA
jgi:hypothetical protein